MDYYRRVIEVARNSKTSQWLSPLLLIADAALCALIIWKVPCMSPERAPHVLTFIFTYAPGASANATKILRSIGRHICNKSINILEANEIIP